MPKWLRTKRIAWGEIIVSLAIGGLGTYLNPAVGIPLFSVLLLFGLYLLYTAYVVGRTEEVVPVVSEDALDHTSTDAWEHYTKLKEAVLQLRSATTDEMRAISDTIQRERVYLDDAELQAVMENFVSILDGCANYGIPASGLRVLIPKVISATTNRMHKRYRRQ